ncbi:hypothetical protein BC349_03470 [Flavihumibacter stibioxidans]|uniref:Uncharacterized protein n=2 Tax=Flavihumibacter stibioxidans TaxID=1834163 RepID=A0ABR7M669_9BACT|nr:hypothetical protein [Flavihumibacter stibioxidans]
MFSLLTRFFIFSMFVLSIGQRPFKNLNTFIMKQDKNPAEGSFNTDPQENIRIENDILKLKMQAEYGASFGSFGDLSPEAERDFLQMVMAFEKMGKDAPAVSVYEFIGKPVIRKKDEIPEEELPQALLQLRELLSENGICLEVFRESDPGVLYHFITDELFQEQIQDIRIPGMVCVFNYEDFHPNHEMELHDATAEIFYSWENNKLDSLSFVLAEFAVLADGCMLSRDQFRDKMIEQRNRYELITGLEFKIGKTSFEWLEEGLGLGFTEGMIKYQAKSAEGENTVEGSFKLYFCNQGPSWQLTFFYLPGFQW